jgi:hypothetical protein
MKCMSCSKSLSDSMLADVIFVCSLHPRTLKTVILEPLHIPAGIFTGHTYKKLIAAISDTS